METISYTSVREKLAATMDKVVADHAPVMITRAGSQPFVLVSLDDWESLEETAYLMSSPVNAARLNESIHALESGHGLITRSTKDLFGVNLSFSPQDCEDYVHWQTTDPKMVERINELLRDIVREPFAGIGKPEALRHHWKGYWSRRIDQKHRLVYRPVAGTILIAQCRFH